MNKETFKNWQNKRLKQYTIEDCLEAMEEGFYTFMNADTKQICQSNMI